MNDHENSPLSVSVSRLGPSFNALVRAYYDWPHYSSSQNAYYRAHRNHALGNRALVI